MKNSEGNVISVSEKARLDQAPAGPIVPGGHKMEEVDAPEDYMRDLKGFCKKHSRK